MRCEGASVPVVPSHGIRTEIDDFFADDHPDFVSDTNLVARAISFCLWESRLLPMDEPTEPDWQRTVLPGGKTDLEK